MKKIDEIKYLKSMMDSCFTYGGLSEKSYYYDKYLLPYKEILGTKLFSKVYKDHKEDLEKNYIIEHNVAIDNEGVKYNSLIKKTKSND
jgi:hypothetical protein